MAARYRRRQQIARQKECEVEKVRENRGETTAEAGRVDRWEFVGRTQTLIVRDWGKDNHPEAGDDDSCKATDGDVGGVVVGGSSDGERDSVGRV